VRIHRHISQQFRDICVMFFISQMTERGKPMEAAPFPNRLRAIELSQSLLVYMAQDLEFQLGDIIRAVTSNTPSSSMATYQLLQRRLTRYKQLQRHLSRDVQITVRTHSITVRSTVKIFCHHRRYL